MSSVKPVIGFCGLGAMGLGMATNLVKLGYPVKGYDVFSKSVERFEAAGGLAVTSLSDSAAESMYYICMVATAAQAETAMFETYNSRLTTGLSVALPKGATFLLCSTVPAAYAQSVERKLKEIGRDDILFIDSPVSGGAARAANGTLSIMAGGSDAAINQGKTILSEMADTKKLYIVRGGVGAGSNMKMVHQVLAAIHILSVSEAMGAAARFGLNARVVKGAIINSDSWSWMFENRVLRILEEDYFPGVSALTIILKDVGIITSMARLEQFPTPLSSISEQVYLSGLSQGYGPNDDSGMVRIYYPDPVLKVNSEVSSEEQDHHIKLVLNMLMGIYICAASEAIGFAHHLGLPLDQFFELVNDAAGGSKMFRKCGGAMIRAIKGEESVLDYSSVGDLRSICEKMSAVVDEMRRVNCPAYLATGALNLLLLAQKRSGPNATVENVLKIWNV
ncbi:oxidoreductase [Patellaria atrata CBS 101060]|uniref:Oxidoreductase n=1 Tax=Patellaria atrata CBS 101060 TaxID=1346257 RepID=A0A9P4S9G3_9PEZI|nr:oxidoreductase [Patellaria atrata CBS 101060]